MTIIHRDESTHFFVRSYEQSSQRWSATFESRMGINHGRWTWGTKPAFWDEMVRASEAGDRVHLVLDLIPQKVASPTPADRSPHAPRSLRLVDGELGQP